MMKRKILSVILAFTMVVGMLPLTNLEVQAEEVNYTMALGMSAIENWNKVTDDLDNTDKIVIGTYDSTPVEWVKLNDAGLMFSTRSLGKSAFKSDGSGYYPDSTLNGAMEDLYKNGLELTDEEKEVIVSTTLEGSSMYSSVSNLDNQFFFPLSQLEFNTYVGSDKTLASDSSGEDYWWMSSSFSDTKAWAVWYTCQMYNEEVNGDGGVRPAFTLNTDSVFFTSASEASKSDFGTIGSDNTSINTWKLTLKNDNDSFAVTLPTTGHIGQEITVNVGTAGTKSEYTQTSAILSDSNDTVVAYGKIGDTETGDKTFTIPSSTAAGEYTLCVFEEQVNSSEETDYASNVVTGNITISAAPTPPPTPSSAPIWTPSEDDLYRSSLVGWMPVEFTTSSVPYEFELINELQGPLCFDVFHAFRGDYIIGATYSSLVDDMRIQQLSQGITVTLQIPSSLQKENRSYEMICVHKDGNAVVLADLDTNSNTITFRTDKGYAFALCYKD